MEHVADLVGIGRGGDGPAVRPEPRGRSGVLRGLRALGGAALDLVFPPRCPVCARLAGADRRPPLCGPCWTSILRLGPPWCERCGRPFSTFRDRPHPASATCAACRRRPPPYLRARSAARYAGTVREALHAFKFLGQTSLAAPLSELLLEVLAADGAPPGDLVVPVPLHAARERERGFNQAALLARRVARRLRTPYDARALRRARATRAQTELSGRERRRNVRGAFGVTDARAVRDRHVLLVDDVLTTGATVAECARVLGRAGARTVAVVTVARVA
jgi:ComF family protein